MNTEFFVVNELAALLAPPIALLTTAIASANHKSRILIFGHASAFVFALFGSSWALSHCAMAPIAVNLMNLPIQLEAVSSCLLTGITFIAAVVIAFSDRYLLGETTRFSFLRYLSLLSSVSAFMVITNSLVAAFICWTLLSFGLWGVMRLQPENALESATIVRYHLLSDLALFLAIALLIVSRGSYTFSELASGSLSLKDGANPDVGIAASLLLVLAFSIKSALFPFHRWLLATLNAPTPLSGLLHAGIVNVSAILAWRLLPFLQEHSFSLVAWGLLSAISAIVSTLSMSAQPDVKRKLVYSTSGQMGFMSLQCAIGMPGAAIFHLLVHGLFKCHMFLQSGSAVSEGLSKRKYGYANGLESRGARYRKMVLVAASAVAFCIAAVLLAGSWASTSAVIAAAALVSSIPALDRVEFGSLSLSWLGMLTLVLASAVGSNHFEHLVQAHYSTSIWALPAFLMLSFSVALLLIFLRRSRLAKALYVHSLNGFYISELDLRHKSERA